MTEVGQASPACRRWRERSCSRHLFCWYEWYYRRRIPHRRQGDIVYLVTWRLTPSERELDSRERDLVVAAMKHFDARRYELIAYIVMNDHVHALLRSGLSKRSDVDAA
jgi:hypothetical protein